MTMMQSLLAEFDHECGTTRRLLERIPDAKLGWKPHPRSMTLGELAWHLATISKIGSLVTQNQFDLATMSRPPAPRSSAEIVAALGKGQADLREAIGGMSDAKAQEPWTLLKAGKVLLTVPRAGIVRTIVLNHSYHHRGQLAVYLRLLDIPVPSIYGPSADEDRSPRRPGGSWR